MADVTPAITEIETYGDDCHIILWEELDATDTEGSPIEMPGSADRSVQVIGTFDSNTITIEGSNDGTNYETLTDIHGNAATFTASGIKQLAEVTRYIRPTTSGGSGSDFCRVLSAVAC